jgi:REP element-mobilizing transposase RayT
MNRGRRQQDIFLSQDHYDAFLSTLEEAHRRFGVQILCYCLMSSYYHLLVKTPEANLGRAMRHINGVYTQRHNRLLKTDGFLFRGRYKLDFGQEKVKLLNQNIIIFRKSL